MKKILVANRGEIAVRVMKTAKKMGIKTVAVYSEADRNALHVRFADEAVLLGPPASAQSYLLGDKIIEVALKLDVDGIHPGYGFLSENAEFAKKVEDAGIIFIGPNQEAIITMGSKLKAKEAVKKYDIPMVPGVDSAITDIAAAKEMALKIGYPILIKASAGGGGKGMKLVEIPSEFEEAMDRAQSEARSSFGDDAVFIEKFVTSPRHIEVQILADNHGNVVHLFERECSIQRRHQKVIEEAPSSILTPELRKSIGEHAVLVAKSCKYSGAGTVEFLMDADMNYYFLEMNTRLQVEHPVTEMITGIDLVEQQILIAEGQPLPFSQDDLSIHGHALELRIYAEDPFENFAPSIGILKHFEFINDKNVRLDTGYESGMEIPIYYDPMIAKLITFGKTRSQAIQKMLEVIDHAKVEGIKTTLPFGKFVFQHEAFLSGNFDTKFVPTYFTEEAVNNKNLVESELAAMVGLKIFLENSKKLVL